MVRRRAQRGEAVDDLSAPPRPHDDIVAAPGAAPSARMRSYRCEDIGPGVEKRHGKAAASQVGKRDKHGPARQIEPGCRKHGIYIRVRIVAWRERGEAPRMLEP